MFDFVSEPETGGGGAQVKNKEQEPQRRSGDARESIGKQGKARRADKGSANGGWFLGLETDCYAVPMEGDCFGAFRPNGQGQEQETIRR